MFTQTLAAAGKTNDYWVGNLTLKVNVTISKQSNILATVKQHQSYSNRIYFPIIWLYCTVNIRCIYLYVVDLNSSNWSVSFIGNAKPLCNPLRSKYMAKSS